jgi:hypothetical protein
LARRRNNLERTSAPAADSPATTTQTANADDLFSFVTPTEFVDLPSQGRFYPEGHPLHGVDSLEIRHMTAKEEDILTSETLLRKGVAIDRLLQSVMMDKDIKVDDLLVGDKNALLVASRITGFGPDYLVTLTCPSCAAANETEIDLTTLGISDSEETEAAQVTGDGTYKVTLPQTGVTVELKLLTSGDERSLMQGAEKRKKLKLPENNATTQLNALIVSANGVTDRAMITKLVGLLPLRDAQFARATYEAIKPDLDMGFPFTCESCNHTTRMEMPLTAEFFWPKR